MPLPSTRLPAIVSLVLFVVCQSGCATILSERRYPVTIDNPPGPTQFSVIDDRQNVIHQGVTPQQVTLDAKRSLCLPANYSVVFSGPNNVRQTKTIKAKPDPWILGNFVFGGVPGFVVDGVSGAMYKLPENVLGNVLSHHGVANTQASGSVVSADASNGLPAMPVSAQLTDQQAEPNTALAPEAAAGNKTVTVPIRTASAIDREIITDK
ncbi:hypothetical protein [Roseiconus lacunae]|uniref:Uncharacterized protein n=1 Tax=Roseiconus lacunae TaxID=2605694 RepID=A0ABT7PN98_9BACT|nr:hypothetical protein [Roseiconus lacunae]MDM4017961.1 hypothetical protein [Roseiconus lacunae]